MNDILIGKEVIVYDRYLFAVPVKGVIAQISGKDGAFSVVFYDDNPGSANVKKHDGKFFHHQQCRFPEVSGKIQSDFNRVLSKSKVDDKIKPAKIQTEFEWIKERYDLLTSLDLPEDSILRKEAGSLYIWLGDNQPEDWQTCTKENIKPGNVVRLKANCIPREVECICKDGQIIMYNKSANKSFPITDLSNYEINLAEESLDTEFVSDIEC